MGAKANTKVAVEQEDPRREITFEEIAARAYEIHVSGTGVDDVQDWLRAESELIAELESGHEIEQHEPVAA